MSHCDKDHKNGVAVSGKNFEQSADGTTAQVANAGPRAGT